MRGPARSTQPPQSAAAEPRKTKNRVKVQPSSALVQSQLVVKARPIQVMSWGQATGLVIPIACARGSQNTEKPYAMPIHRWMARAAGGTSQRLKPGPAMVRSRARKPGPVRACVVVDIRSLPFAEDLKRGRWPTVAKRRQSTQGVRDGATTAWMRTLKTRVSVSGNEEFLFPPARASELQRGVRAGVANTCVQ